MYRMIKHLERLVEEDKIEENDPIIDLGTGNGYDIPFPISTNKEVLIVSCSGS